MLKIREPDAAKLPCESTKRPPICLIFSLPMCAFGWEPLIARNGAERRHPRCYQSRLICPDRKRVQSVITGIPFRAHQINSIPFQQSFHAVCLVLHAFPPKGSALLALFLLGREPCATSLAPTTSQRVPQTERELNQSTVRCLSFSKEGEHCTISLKFKAYG
ncbi:hypothetical protein AVEN_132655-1 [Araneus ventricosus]|uniref:Uncharacterized protein n=1 Tax=Araneus ventricosus TaxID=182803 RepID=A0A4Y2AX59_ARAVE|nr:hypothetical protein AVEN_132655-1 [Araneus ventricosus]